MKTVVITGSGRGLGFEMAKVFRTNEFNVVISDIIEENLNIAKTELLKLDGKGGVIAVPCDVTKENDLKVLLEQTLNEFGEVSIWINNAGVNQPNMPIWQVETKNINMLIDIDLKATIIGSKIAMGQMVKQGFGAIYNIEGHGSNDNVILGLSVYGTAKRAVTYFTEALGKEIDMLGLNIKVGKLSPGIMITNFISNAMINEKINLDDKTKKVYNILGDYPDVIAKFLVEKMINNTKNNVKFEWLTGGKAAIRFMTSGFNKRDFFK